MVETRVRRRIAVAGLVLVVVTSLQLVSIRPAGAVAVAECAGTYTINIPDTIESTTVVGDTDNWSLSCGVVNPSANPIVGAVQVFPYVTGNSFTYTGNCVRGALSFSTGGGGLFIAGVVLLDNVASAHVVTALVKPNGTPCEGMTGSTRSWNGVLTSVAAN